MIHLSRYLRVPMALILLAFFVFLSLPKQVLAGDPPNILDDNRGDVAKTLAIDTPYNALLILLNSYVWNVANLVPLPVSLSSHVIQHPKIFNIYFDDDWNGNNPDAPTMEQINAFTQALVAGPYFNAASHYGVGSATYTGSAGMYDACLHLPGSVREFGEMMVWAACMASFPAEVAITLGGPTTTGVPNPDDDTLYVIYLPRSNTMVEQPCSSSVAYHFMDTAAKFSITLDLPPSISLNQTFAFAVIQTGCAQGSTKQEIFDN